ncbi:hypothetical protein [Helicobacter sp. MIT 05-5294]|uniref:hypothetical protein n=1 Tax=Helicobacter sp. MIT 05-5294 TaxID=1548150 RepID=UPI0010FEB861|nr:hypothetical protein [Helicobacter sp. MIT 05-5294]TLD87257.1 hypothetical protein LS69_004360 [Helicobacter sp. MIT 05-5294]
MKVHLMIFGICFALCLNASERQKDTKTDSPQAQQTTQINADSKNKLIVPLEEITDENLLKLNTQMQEIIHRLGKEDLPKLKLTRKDKRAIQAYLDELKSNPNKAQVYSRPIEKTMKRLHTGSNRRYENFIEWEQYYDYAKAYKDYFADKNQSLIDFINRKMDALESLSESDYDLVEKLKSLIKTHCGFRDCETAENQWLYKVSRYYRQQPEKYDWEEERKSWYEFLTQNCASDLKSAAYSDIPLEERNVLLAQAEPICQKEMAFAQKYFEPLYLSEEKEIDELTGQSLPIYECLDSEAESVCDYKLKMPLKLTGTLKVIRDYSVGACDTIDVEWIEFEPDSKELPSFLQHGFNLDLQPNMKHYKALEPYIPQWFKDNLAGEIALRAEIEAGDYFRADFSACSFGHSMQVKNMKIIKPTKEKLYGREKYADPIEYDMRIHLTSKDSYVNLRESPNGKILRRIELGDGYLLWNLGESHSQWLKVLYFPPNVDDAKKAVIGYIHKSQIERESLE